MFSMAWMLLGCTLGDEMCTTDTAETSFLKVDLEHDEQDGIYDIAVEWDAERASCTATWPDDESSCAGPSNFYLHTGSGTWRFTIEDEAPAEVAITVERDDVVLYDDTIVPEYTLNEYPNCPDRDNAWARVSISY